MALGRLRTTDQVAQRSQSHLLVPISLSFPQIMFTGPCPVSLLWEYPRPWHVVQCGGTFHLVMLLAGCFLLLPALSLWALTSALCLEFMYSLCRWRLSPFLTPGLPSLAGEVILCKPELSLSHVSPELPLKYLFLDQPAPFSEQSTVD